MTTEQYRSGHNEHDWKSCDGDKPSESSNLSCSATPSRTTYRSRRHFYAIAHSLRRSGFSPKNACILTGAFLFASAFGRKRRLCRTFLRGLLKKAGENFYHQPKKALSFNGEGVHLFPLFPHLGAVAHGGEAAVSDDRAFYQPRVVKELFKLLVAVGEIFHKRRVGRLRFFVDYVFEPHRRDNAVELAGPASDEAGTPVGTVFVSLATHRAVYTRKLHLGHDRERVRVAAANHALDMVRRFLTDLPVEEWEK